MNDAGKDVFLGRQPILDRRRNIVGYELLFRATDTHYADVENFSNADLFVVSHMLSNFGIREVLGRHLGFVNVTERLLMSDSLELLPVGKIVVEILETVKPSESSLRRCRELKDLGFTLALDDNLYHPDYEPFYDIVDIVKIDILQLSPERLTDTITLLGNRGLKLLAEKVETVQQYRHCLELGFDLFQGYYFARPAVLNRKKVDASGIALLRLLGLVCRDAEISEIEEAVKQNPNLSYNLLRLVNSVVIGMKERIRTLRHALTVLGMSQLKRWIQLALFASDKQGEAGNPLLETAATRGRLMELLALRLRQRFQDRDCSDTAFMTGVLSLVDVLLETPMEEIADQLNLSEEVRLALLRREGPLGCLLLLAEKLETLDFGAVKRILAGFKCEMGLLLEAQLEAIAWTNGLDDLV